MNDINHSISELEKAEFAIRLTICTLKGDDDPNPPRLSSPPPLVELSRENDHLCILIKKY